MDPYDKQWCQPPAKKSVITFVKRITAKPIAVFVQRIKAFIAAVPFCGIWQRKILARLDQWICLLNCDGGVIGAQVTVTDHLVVIREREARAKKTYVTNLGPSKCRLYEAGRLVRVLYPGTFWESPTTGQMQLSAMCDAGLSTLVEVTTEKRCQCGLEDYYNYSGGEPIGAGQL